MRVYIRSQAGDALIEKGKILSIGGTNGHFLVTGEDELMPISVGKYRSRERAEEVLNEIIQRIVEPRAREVEKGVIFIDLKGIE